MIIKRDHVNLNNCLWYCVGGAIALVDCKQKATFVCKFFYKQPEIQSQVMLVSSQKLLMAYIYILY